MLCKVFLQRAVSRLMMWISTGHSDACLYKLELGKPKARGWLGGPAVDQAPLPGKVLHYIPSQGTHTHSQGHTDLDLPTFSVARSK